jgi:hypothetical protein
MSELLVIIYRMKGLFAATLFLFCDAPAWAQGMDIGVEGSAVYLDYLNLVSNTSDGVTLTLETSPQPAFQTSAAIFTTRFQSMESPLTVQTVLEPSPIFGESSSGVEMAETTRMGGHYTPTEFTYIPSSPDMQTRFNQAGIQSVPEPSAFALGGLAFCLIGVARLRRR